MTITVTAHPSDNTETNTYPCLGKYPNGMIVLFTSGHEGTILVKSSEGTNDVGYHGYNFTRNWQPFIGTLEIISE